MGKIKEKENSGWDKSLEEDDKNKSDLQIHLRHDQKETVRNSVFRQNYREIGERSGDRGEKETDRGITDDKVEKLIDK